MWARHRHFTQAAGISRRDWLRMTSLGVGLGTASASGWLQSIATLAADQPKRRHACILLWMNGGPSQIDTFDLKPGHENGGEFKEIETSASGIRISEHLPTLASQMKDMAIVRSMSTKEGDHARASYFLRTGRLPQGPIRYPTLGSVFSKELAPAEAELPNFVSIAPYRFLSPDAFGPGFLGPQYAPMIVGESQTGNTPQGGNDSYGPSLRVENLNAPGRINRAQADARLKLVAEIDSEFQSTRPGVPVESHRAAYEQATRLMRSSAVEAFDLDHEPTPLREKYGKNRFGQGCLLARRLIERGVPFVEVALNGTEDQQGFGWDTHQNNFPAVKALSAVLDAGWGTLMEDLRTRGLLETTLIVWMGEFGRTPKINPSAGRDHFPAAWSTVLAGGGVRGGQVVGRTSEDGMTVADRPVGVGDFMATLCEVLKIDGTRQNMSNVGRPIRIVEPDSKPIKELLT